MHLISCCSYLAFGRNAPPKYSLSKLHVALLKVCKTTAYTTTLPSLCCYVKLHWPIGARVQCKRKANTLQQRAEMSNMVKVW